MRALLFCFLLGLTAAFPAARAMAETDFDAVGGPGAASFEDRCPPGQWLTAIRGRSGSWVDQVQIGCAPVTRFPTGGDANHLRIGANLAYGPARGGGGGGAMEFSCGGVIRGIWPHMTPGNRQVKYIDVWCMDLSGRHGQTARFNPLTNPYQDVNGGADQPRQQICPDQDGAVGLRGRYGADVNAIAVICVPFDPPMDASYRPPAPPQDNRPIHVTGAAPAPAPPVFTPDPSVFTPDPSPVFTPTEATPAPAPPARVVTQGPFYGMWQVTESDGVQFTVSLQQKLGTIANSFTGWVQAPGGTHVTIHGTTPDPSHVRISFAQNGGHALVALEISADGQSFTGPGRLADGTLVTWTGQRDGAAAAAIPANTAPPDATPPDAAPPAAPPPSSAPPPRVIAQGPFYGVWLVTESDGVQYTVSLQQKLGTIANSFTGWVQAPGGTHVTIHGTTPDPSHVRISFAQNGGHALVALTISADGQSVTGPGRLADGTSVSWTGQREATPPTAPPNDAPPVQPGQ